MKRRGFLKYLALAPAAFAACSLPKPTPMVPPDTKEFDTWHEGEGDYNDTLSFGYQASASNGTQFEHGEFVTFGTGEFTVNLSDSTLMPTSLRVWSKNG